MRQLLGPEGDYEAGEDEWWVDECWEVEPADLDMRWNEYRHDFKRVWRSAARGCKEVANHIA